MEGILGRKIQMTQMFTEKGVLIPVTVIEATPNLVIEVKSPEKHGYAAARLAAGEKREGLFNKPDLGQFTKLKVKPKALIREVKDMTSHKVGEQVNVDVFAAGELVNVTGISKGKGFAGVIKRHNQKTGPKSHGSHYHRAVGSMGAISPNRVLKGKALPGRMGGEKKTVLNLEIIKVDLKKNALVVKGAIPGPNKSWVLVTTNNRNKAKKPAAILNNYTQVTAMEDQNGN